MVMTLHHDFQLDDIRKKSVKCQKEKIPKKYFFTKKIYFFVNPEKPSTNYFLWIVYDLIWWFEAETPIKIGPLGQIWPKILKNQY